MGTEASAPSASHAEGGVYRPHERTSRLRFTSPPASVSALGILALCLLLPVVAFGLPPAGPHVPGLSGLPGGGYLAGVLLFLVPGALGALATTPLAKAFGGRLRMRRALLLGLSGLFLVLAVLLLWRLVRGLSGSGTVEGPLLLAFGLTLWIRQLTLVAVSHREHARSLPAALVVPLLGFVMAWGWLGLSAVRVVEGVAFLLLSLGGAIALVTATDRPMVREFGQGGTSLLRPLMEHMSDRDPGASQQMEAFFEGISTRGHLKVGALTFREGSRLRLAWIAPAVHPGPFAELGSSDLPHKLAQGLRGTLADDVVVPHSPSTHAQDIPTSAELARLTSQLKQVLETSGPAGEARASPLVAARPGSLARAQVLGENVLIVLTQAPAPTDDIDYALSELIREEARRQGFAHAVIVDAHNSFVENKGEIPFGSPEGFRLVADARESMEAARAKTVPSEVRLGLAHRRGFNPEEHGMGPEGLAVVLVEAAGVRTAYALFDANNLEKGLRDPLVRVLKETIGGDGEVMTTDNHLVHEVQGATNPLGRRRSVAELSEDLRSVAREAVADLRPVRVGGVETTVHDVKVLGPGVTTRLMTALADSFAIFWLFFVASITIAALAGALLLTVLGG